MPRADLLFPAFDQHPFFEEVACSLYSGQTFLKEEIIENLAIS